MLLDAGSARSASPPDGQTQAAVLVPLFEHEGQLHAVFTRRRTDLRRHAGEISFPGGRRDLQDPTLMHTALREAEEEIGLPAQHVAVLGALSRTSTFATNYAIHPFVGLISRRGTWTLSPQEVDAVLELPLGALAAGRTRRPITRRGFTFEADCYVVDGHLIWGATARILEELLERAGSLMRLSRPARPPGSPTPSTSRRSS